MKFLFSALSHPLSKPFLLWKVPQAEAPRDPFAVRMAWGFSLQWPPVPDLLQHCPAFTKLVCSWILCTLTKSSKWTQGRLQEAYPIEPTETKHFILPEHIEIRGGSWQGWDTQLCQVIQNTHTHIHTQHLRFSHFTGLPMPPSPSEHSLFPPLVYPHLKATFSFFVNSFQTSTDMHFNLFTPIKMLVWSWRGRCIRMSG